MRVFINKLYSALGFKFFQYPTSPLLQTKIIVFLLFNQVNCLESRSNIAFTHAKLLIMKNLISIILFLCCHLSSMAQAGAPDLSFGANGSLIVNFSASHDKELIRDLSTTATGEIVLGGLFYEYTAYGAARVTAEGRKDSTFNEDGIYFVQDYYAPIFVAEAVAVQPDRKVIIGGAERGFVEPELDRLWMRRLKADGHPDLSFGLNSVVLTDVTPFHDYAKDILVLPDGNILVAATIDSDETLYETPPALAVLKYLPNGKLDTSFGVAGVARIETPGYPGRYIAENLAVYPDGKIVIQGIRRYSTSSSWQFTAVARLLPNGQKDPDFGWGSGFKVFSISPYHVEDVVKLLPLDNGKLLMIGSWRNFSNQDVYYITRLETNGTPDYSFSGSGLKEFAIHSSNEDFFIAEDAVLQPDGKVILVGNGYYDQMLLARHLPNGDLDPSFGNGGYRTYMIPNLEGAIHTDLQPGGKIVVCGWVDHYTQIWRFHNDLSHSTSPEQAETPAIQVTPNPASDRFWVDLGQTDNGKWFLFNTAGACVLEMPVKDTQYLEVGVATLPRGIYVWAFQASTGTHCNRGKVVIW